MTAVPAGWTPRTITIYCDGRDSKGAGDGHPEVDLAALVSYEWQGREWWDADERARRPAAIQHPDAAPGRPDIQLMLMQAAVWWEIACPLCGRWPAQSGDAFGIGYRTPAQLLAEHRAGITSAVKHARQVPNHERLSAFADIGVPRLPLSGLRPILDGRH